MFFNDLSGLVRVLVVGVLAYVALVVLLRISGKRTLSKMNAFDLVVTIALGSTLATVLLSRDVPLAEGVLGFTLLVTLQWLVAWLSTRSSKWRNLVKSEPRLLVFRGELLHDAMREERITADEVFSAMRSNGHRSLQQVEAVVLETDGTVSVIKAADQQQEPSALQHVRGFPPGT